MIPRRDPLRLSLELAPRVELHRVELTVRTASGRTLDGRDGSAALRRFFVEPAGESEALQWSEGTARTALVGLRAGPVQLRADWGNGWFPTEPETLAFEAPHEPLEIRVRDDLPTEQLVLRVIEPTTKARLLYKLGADFPVIHRIRRFNVEDTIRLPDGRRAFEHITEPYASILPVQSVELTMEGYERVWLGPADIPPADAEGRRVVELVPRRGWNVRVSVVQGADEEAVPQPGIVLAFDGVETLASNAEGILIHRAETQPERVSVVTRGWELVHRTSYYGAGTVHGDTGHFTLDDGRLTVEVRRRE